MAKTCCLILVEQLVGQQQNSFFFFFFFNFRIVFFFCWENLNKCVTSSVCKWALLTWHTCSVWRLKTVTRREASVMLLPLKHPETHSDLSPAVGWVRLLKCLGAALFKNSPLYCVFPPVYFSHCGISHCLSDLTDKCLLKTGVYGNFLELFLSCSPSKSYWLQLLDPCSFPKTHRAKNM